MELMVWRVPRPVPPTHHGCIYRAVYAVDGVRVVGSTMNAERAITAICKGGRCLAHSPRLTPWWKTSWLRWMRPGQRHDKATHAHHHHEAGGVLCPLADMHIAGRTAQVGDPRAAGRSLLDRRNLLRPAGLRADGADRTPGLAEGGAGHKRSWGPFVPGERRGLRDLAPGHRDEPDASAVWPRAGDPTPRAAGIVCVRATQDRVNPLLERPLTLARPFGDGSMSSPEPSS